MSLVNTPTTSIGQPKIVFIVGAGASAPYGLPTGAQLKKEAMELCTTKMISNPKDLFFGKDTEWIKKFVTRIQSYDSLDAYAFQENDLRISRFIQGLIGFILGSKMQQWESKCSEYEDWIEKMINKLRNFKNDPPDPSKLRILTFNYDRILEKKFKNEATTNPNEKWQGFFGNLRIDHVYGALNDTLPGPLRNPPDNTYGEDSYWHYAQDIKLMRVDQNNEGDFDEIIKNSPRIYFLGFGFHEINLEKIGIKAQQPSLLADDISKILTATSLDPDIDMIARSYKYKTDSARAFNITSSCYQTINNWFNPTVLYEQ